MPIELKDLKPRASEVEIKGKLYELKPFKLAIRIWAEHEFKTKDEKSGLKVLSKLLAGIEINIDAALDAACKVIYKLLVDKSDFKNLNDFLIKAGKYNNIMPMYYALCECIGHSEPQISEIEKEQFEVKKHVAAKA